MTKFKTIKMKKILYITLLLAGMVGYAQTSSGINTLTPNANADLELGSTNKGLLVNRVALTDVTAVAPLTAHVAGMMVYNTATAGTAPNNVTPGYYYNDGTKWIKVGGGTAEPWFGTDDKAEATLNTEDIYTMGKVGIGVDTPETDFHVKNSEDANVIVETLKASGGVAGLHLRNLNDSYWLQNSYNQFRINHNSTPRMVINNGGDVGIGTTLPEVDLHVWDSNNHSDLIVQTGTNSASASVQLRTVETNFWFQNLNTAIGMADNQFRINQDLTPRIVIDYLGNVGVGGITAPTEKLHVIGNILASGTITPDYVFEKYYDGESTLKADYKMMSLSEIEAYTRANKHLPGVPSAQEVEDAGGILVNRATEVNLEKIEELFLHTIEQQKTIETLEGENEALKARLAKIEAKLGL